VRPTRRVKWTVVPLLLLAVIPLVNHCGGGPGNYGATVKLLVVRFGEANRASEGRAAADTTFYETQAGILRSRMIQRRALEQLEKTDAEMGQSLLGLDVTRQGTSDILVVSVTSRSREFAPAYATALVDEYMKYRREETAKIHETTLGMLTREIERLAQELKAANEKIIAYAKEHGVGPEAETPELVSLRDNRESIRSLHNTMMVKLMSVDATSIVPSRTVTVLEPAATEPGPAR